MDGNVPLTEAARFEQDRDVFEMANLYPRDTGLPMTVWVSPKGRARHHAWVKVCMTPGERMDADHVAVVSIRPEPRLLHGDLSGSDFIAVRRWIAANAALLIDYWDGRASTFDLVRGLQPLTPGA